MKNFTKRTMFRPGDKWYTAKPEECVMYEILPGKWVDENDLGDFGYVHNMKVYKEGRDVFRSWNEASQKMIQSRKEDIKRYKEWLDKAEKEISSLKQGLHNEVINGSASSQPEVETFVVVRNV